jgi:hypothetical protein
MSHDAFVHRPHAKNTNMRSGFSAQIWPVEAVRVELSQLRVLSPIRFGDRLTYRGRRVTLSPYWSAELCWARYAWLGKKPEARHSSNRGSVELQVARRAEYAEEERLLVGLGFTANGRSARDETVMSNDFPKWSPRRWWSGRRHSGRLTPDTQIDPEPDRPAGGEQQVTVEAFVAEDWDPEHPDLQHEPPLVCTEDPVDFEPGEGETDRGELPAEIPDAEA